MEEWKPIKGFPGYQVSDYGRIYSDKTGTMMSFSMNTTGTLKVNLMRQREIITRSVPVLVAEAFLGGRPRQENMTPIHVDGDPRNNHADNLAWRPRWFAWKYARQFTEPIPPEYQTPVLNLLTNIRYLSVVAAGLDDAVLWEYVYNSILTGRPVFPTGATYDFA